MTLLLRCESVSSEADVDGFGVPVSEPSARGVTAAEQYGGQPYGRAVGYNYGVPAPFSGAPGPEEVVHDEHKCSETTKKGKPCGAPPAKGTSLCIGHLRSASTKES